MSTHIWLRAETKPAEQRTALPPAHAKRLMNAGFELTIEASSQSAFRPEEYEAVGCKLVDEHQWRVSAPEDAIILGLKELPESDEPLHHRHVHFAHVYKNQEGWQASLDRFVRGGGTLYDLEFLVDDAGKRVAAFGYWAGFAGAAVATLAWANYRNGRDPVLESLVPRTDRESLIEEIRGVVTQTGSNVSGLIIGALGRCGRGATEFFDTMGVPVAKWDLAETSRGGPFREIIDVDIFLNCVFVDRQIPPFLNTEMLQNDQRKLSVICDVSCDPYGDYNPVPVYQQCTTFDNPIATIVDSAKPVFLIAIDHLPSLLPRESSEDFCDQLMPYLLEADQMEGRVWQRAESLFREKTSKLISSIEDEKG